MLLNEKDYNITKERLLTSFSAPHSIYKILLRFTKDTQTQTPLTEIIYITDKETYLKYSSKLEMILPIFDAKNYDKKMKNISQSFNIILDSKIAKNSINELKRKKTLNYFKNFENLINFKRKKDEKELITEPIKPSKKRKKELKTQYKEKEKAGHLYHSNYENNDTFYHIFTSNKDEIIKQIFLIFYSANLSSKYLKEIKRILVKNKFNLSKFYQNKLADFEEEEWLKALSKIEAEQGVIKNKKKLKDLKQKFLSSKEFIFKKELEHFVYLETFISTTLLKHRAKILEDDFFDKDKNLIITSKEKLEEKWSNFEHKIYDNLYPKTVKKLTKDNNNLFLKLLNEREENKEVKTLYQSAENLYKYLERNLLFDNLYSINHKDKLTDREIEVYNLLYTSSKRYNQLYHNQQLLELFNYDDVSNYYDVIKTSIYDKKQSLYQHLLENDIDSNNWEEEAKTHGININYEMLLESEDEIDSTYEDTTSSYKDFILSSANDDMFKSNLSLQELEKFLKNNQINKIKKSVDGFNDEELFFYNEELEDISSYIDNTPLFNDNSKSLDSLEYFNDVDDFINAMKRKLPSKYTPSLQVDELMYEDEIYLDSIIEYFVDEFKLFYDASNEDVVDEILLTTFFHKQSIILDIAIHEEMEYILEDELKKLYKFI